VVPIRLEVIVLRLSDTWGPKLSDLPETGMGYQIVSIILKDGRRFDQVIIVGDLITKVRGVKGIPFCEDDIAEVIVTHDKWDWDRE